MNPIPTAFGAVLVAALAIGTALLVVGCREQKPALSLPANAVAVVGTQVITLQAFQQELARRASTSPGRTFGTAEKQALLEEMIRFETLHQKALASGYDKDPQIAATVKRMIVARFQEDQLAQAAPPKATPEDIADFYQKNPQRFGTPEKIRVALIELRVAQTASAEKRAEAARRAQAVLAEARAAETSERTFGLLAQKYSEHQPSRYRGGDIGWLTVGATNTEWPPAVLEALFKLAQPGEISPVIETPTAFHLVKLVEKQPANVRPLAEVKDGVEYLVSRQREHQRQEEIHAALKQGLDIRINQELIDSIPSPARPTRPPGVPGGPTAHAGKPPMSSNR